MAKAEKDFFTQALYADLLRGKDSTGIFTVSKEVLPKVELFKKAYPAPDFLELPLAKKMINGLGDSCVAVGHNRAATKGSVVHQNAHPFHWGSITLVHNGTLTSYTQLPGYKHGEVDSKLLCRSIYELGVQETINKVTGAYALIWHDSRDNSLHFLRNNQRDFHMAISADNKSLYWASELGMLEWLLDRNKLSYNESFITEPDLHISFNLNDEAFIPVTETVVKEVKSTKWQGKGTRATTQTSTDTTKSKKPQSERRGENDARKLAKEKGLTIPKVGERVEGYFYMFQNYRGNTVKGKIEGCGSSAEMPYNMELHEIDKAGFVEGYYSFEVIAVTYDYDDGDFIIRGRSPVLEIKFDNNNSKMEEVNKEITDGLKKTLLTTEENLRLEHKKSTESGELTSRELIKQKTSSTTTSPSKPSKPKLTIKETAKQKKRGNPRHTTVDKNLKATLNKVLSHGFVNPTSGDAEYIYQGPNGLKCNLKSFNVLTKHGCASCSGDLLPADSDTITWVDTQTPLCVDCAAEREYSHKILH